MERKKLFLLFASLLPVVLWFWYSWLCRYMMQEGVFIAPAGMQQYQWIGTAILVLALSSGVWVAYLWIAKSALREIYKNILLSFIVLYVLFCLAECFFLHYEKPSGIGERWSYKLWDKKYLPDRVYWHFINSKGQNDRADFREPLPVMKGKKSIWFIGDSFTFGFGLKQTAQTFPARVEQELNGKALCVNLGDGGADTYHEKEILFAFDSTVKQTPYAVVWQYFGNDIDSADEGPDIYEKQLAKSAWVQFGRKFFKGKSFLLDFIYWEYFTRNEAGTYNAYIDFLNKAYTTDSIVVDGKALKDSLGYITPFSKHLQPLKQAAAYYKNEGVKFLVIIFPYLWNGGPENADKIYAKRIENELKAENTDVINLTPLVKNLPADKRMINAHDLHPSALVDKIAADTISRYFACKKDL